MDVNYEYDNFLSNHSSETEYYDSTTLQYSGYNSSEPVTKISNEDDYHEPNWPNWRDDFWVLFDKVYLWYNLGWTIALIVVYTLIFIIGFVGNWMILVVIKRPQMRTVTNLLIMNLAVADLLVIIYCVPTDLLFNIFKPWIMVPVMCKVAYYMKWVSFCASAYSLAAISIDRCKAIYRPIVPPRGLSNRQVLFTVGLIWTVSLTLPIPLAIVYVMDDDDPFPICNEKWESPLLERIYFFGVFVLLLYCWPLILILISNIIIWRNVSKRKAPNECARASRIGRMHRETRQSVGKMLGIVTLMFLLSWLRYYGILIPTLLVGNYDEKLMDILFPLTSLLGCSNSSINPVLYAFMSKKFRNAYKSLLPKWLRCIQRTENNCEKSCASRETMTNDITL